MINDKFDMLKKNEEAARKALEKAKTDAEKIRKDGNRQAVEEKEAWEEELDKEKKVIFKGAEASAKKKIEKVTEQKEKEKDKISDVKKSTIDKIAEDVVPLILKE